MNLNWDGYASTRQMVYSSGANADIGNSGATLAYPSPGVTVHLSNQLHVYAFVQVPVYQHVTGYQIEPRFLASVSVHYNF
jgi:hypothetical protein